MGNGSWLNVGGNNAVTTLGVALDTVGIPEGGGAYRAFDGGRSTRVMTPCADQTCNWTEDEEGIPINRWYPSLETLEDGSVIVIGGELYGGFVNSVRILPSISPFFLLVDACTDSRRLAGQPNAKCTVIVRLPSTSIFVEFLKLTLILSQRILASNRRSDHLSLPRAYPARQSLPSHLVAPERIAFHASGLANGPSQLHFARRDRSSQHHHRAEDLPCFVRRSIVFRFEFELTFGDCSGATAMLPLTVANNFTATLLFCGGMTPERDEFVLFLSLRFAILILFAPAGTTSSGRSSTRRRRALAYRSARWTEHRIGSTKTIFRKIEEWETSSFSRINVSSSPTVSLWDRRDTDTIRGPPDSRTRRILFFDRRTTITPLPLDLDSTATSPRPPSPDSTTAPLPSSRTDPSSSVDRTRMPTLSQWLTMRRTRTRPSTEPRSSTPPTSTLLDPFRPEFRRRSRTEEPLSISLFPLRVSTTPTCDLSLSPSSALDSRRTE